MLFPANTELEDALKFSRFDVFHVLSTSSKHDFELENKTWLSAEHYYQASKFPDSAYGHRIALAGSPQEAHKLGNAWFKRKRPDFKKVRLALMTRALYSKAIQNEEVKAYLLDTGDQKLIEISQFDHYWGVGRDQRGENKLGKIWMDIRKRLKNKEQESS